MGAGGAGVASVPVVLVVALHTPASRRPTSMLRFAKCSCLLLLILLLFFFFLGFRFWAMIEKPKNLNYDVITLNYDQSGLRRNK